jgi:hypothetical protein
MENVEPVLSGGLNNYFGRNQKSFSFTDDRILKLNNGFFDEIKRYFDSLMKKLSELRASF